MKREQIIEILERYEKMPFSRPSECADEILALSLDVPSDGDVIHESSIRFVSNTGYFNVTKAASFKKGAKWMKEEIIKRNK